MNVFQPGDLVRVTGKHMTGARRIVVRESGMLRRYGSDTLELHYLTASVAAPTSAQYSVPACDLERISIPSVFNIGPSKEAPPHG